MQISRDVCGFTGGQADTLRKAIGQKETRGFSQNKKDLLKAR
jgi:DNA polymerase III alpha subunit